MDLIKGRGGGGSYPKAGGVNLEFGGYHRDNHQNSTNHQYFIGVSVKLTLLFMVVSIASLFLNLSTYTTEINRMSYSFSQSNQYYGSVVQQNILSLFRQFITKNLPSQESKLEMTLRKAAMRDKTVIITTLNAAWAGPNSIFDLFLESFKIGNGTQDLLKHVMVGTYDQKAYSRCMEKNLHCYAMRTDSVDFSNNLRFGSEDYLKMVWGRIDFLRTVLQMGYHFIFTDADVMWLRDPFPKFYPDGDFQISCDHYWFSYKDVNNIQNAGFMYAKSNNRTIQFYKYWHAEKDHFPGTHEQKVFDYIKFSSYIKEIGLKLRFLGTPYFSGFCEPSKDLDLVITMHANCCLGLENKTHDIKMVIDDWKKYMSMPSDIRNNLSRRYWTVPRLCGFF